MADVKPIIKPDPEAAASPSAFDEDIYEDAGDLEFNTEEQHNSAYLARIPRHLWEAWSKLDEDAEIEIGKIRLEYIPRNDGQPDDVTLSMLLNADIAQHQGVEKEYNLEINSNDVANTFVFTEQDLPGFKSKARPKGFDLATANMPARFQRQKKEEQTPKQPYDPNKRFQPYFRKAIPKRTTMKARIRHDLSANPVNNAESRFLMAVRTREAMQPKNRTRLINDDTSIASAGFVNAGTAGANAAFGKFIRKDKTPAQKAQTQKTARIPENELLDLLFKCFERYKYWPMKALRAELQQPEAYLREQLDRIAVLAKSGKFATNWSLKPEMMTANSARNEDEAAEATGVLDSDMDLDDEDDDGDIKFEDVS